MNKGFFGLALLVLISACMADQADRQERKEDRQQIRADREELREDRRDDVRGVEDRDGPARPDDEHHGDNKRPCNYKLDAHCDWPAGYDGEVRMDGNAKFVWGNGFWARVV